MFCHNNPWVIIAETVVGRADQAYDYYLRINPSNREAMSEIHRCEPYVYAQTIAGKAAPTFGEAKNSWLTGTASWNLVAITQHILGIRPTLQGLALRPVIPTHWPGYQAIRMYRGVRYWIDVVRRGPGNAVALLVDGAPIEGTLIPIPTDGRSEVHVEAVVS